MLYPFIPLSFTTFLALTTRKMRKELRSTYLISFQDIQIQGYSAFANLALVVLRVSRMCNADASLAVNDVYCENYELTKLKFFSHTNSRNCASLTSV